MKLIESKTYKNLAKAFAGECMAQTRYRFIAYGARAEGFFAIADLVDTVVTQEFNHARMMYTFIQTACEKQIANIDIASGYPFKEKWNLVENLKLASEDEDFEAHKIYPEYADTAEKEGFKDIANFFKNLTQVENCHKMLFCQMHEQLSKGSLYKKPTAVKWKCADCGYEETLKQCWSECPLCQAKQGATLIKIQD